ncbi:hypothetical protein [Halosegnis sp.]|uniref:DUF7549 family protein n=1 Tax=Halosegnis sp. TaxID=2864959 RepID=UPI0035D4F24B
MSPVDPEYAGEFAVVATWLSVLLPWSVSLSAPGGGSFLSVRFPLLSVRLLFGLKVAGEIPLLFVWQAPALPAPGSAAGPAFILWLAGAVVLAIALAISLGYYARETALEAASPVDLVRLLGSLLAIGGSCLLAATILLVLPASMLQALRVAETGYAGVTAPIGALIVPVLGAVALRIDRGG